MQRESHYFRCNRSSSYRRVREGRTETEESVEYVFEYTYVGVKDVTSVCDCV